MEIKKSNKLVKTFPQVITILVLLLVCIVSKAILIFKNLNKMENKTKESLEKQFADYMNMMAAPISKEYSAEITRELKDMSIFKYRNHIYYGIHINGILNKKSISIIHP